MKKCSDCNEEMISNVEIEGQQLFEVGHKGKSRINVTVPTGEKSSFLGIKYEKSKTYDVKARMCPNCGKVELYVELDK